MALSAGDSGEFLWRSAAATNRDELPFFSFLFSSGSREAGASGRERRELRAATAKPPDRDEALIHLLFFFSGNGQRMSNNVLD